MTAVVFTHTLSYQIDSLTDNTWYVATFGQDVPKSVIDNYAAELKRLGFVNIQVTLHIT